MSTSNSSTKVILVEDNPADVELTKIAYAALSDKIELLHYADGKQLLESLPGLNLSDISYLLLDLNMPKLGGLDVLKIFSNHEVWFKIPVIVFTSSFHNGDISNCYLLGTNAYVAKPVDIEQFEKTIATIHQFWGKTNIRPHYNHTPS